jgi:hypothetical protein
MKQTYLKHYSNKRVVDILHKYVDNRVLLIDNTFFLFQPATKY